MKYQLSIIIPVLNESYIINAALRHLQNMEYNEAVEIIVVDGDPAGSTLNFITTAGITKTTASKGRGSQMNKGALLSSGEILLFLHADSVLPAPNAFTMMQMALDSNRVSAGAFSLKINSKRNAFRIIEKMVALRTRVTKIPYGDQAIFMKKDVFRQLRGFRENQLMEDVDLMRRLKRIGGKVIILPAKVSTSSRRWDKEGLVYCTLRNWTLMTLYLLGVSPDRLIKFYG